MKMKIYFLAFVLFSLAQNAVSVPITFQKTYRTAEPASISAAIIRTLEGNYCTGGAVGDNNSDILLAKLDGNGDTLWTRTYGGNLREDFGGLVQTRDSGFLLCGSSYSFSSGTDDAYVIRTDKNGNVRWSKNYGGGASDKFTTIRQTADGGFIATGTTSSGFGSSEILLVKLDTAGGITWSKTIGGSGDDWGLCLRETYDQGFIITGYTTAFGASSGRICLIKTDSLGAVTWSSVFGGVVNDGGYSVRQCRDSGYIVTGYTKSFTTGTMDAFLLKATKTGGLSWMKTYGGSSFDCGYDVEQTADNGFMVAGFTETFGPDSTAAAGPSIYMIKTDALGNTLWTRAHAGDLSGYGYALLQTADAGYLVAEWRYGFRLTKTDSLGTTSCVHKGTGTVTTAVTPTVTAGATSSTSSTITSGNAATVTRYMAAIKSVPCSNVPAGLNAPLGHVPMANVYPNPFSNSLHVEVSEPGISELMVYNLLAQKMIHEHFGHRKTVSTETLLPGIYYYEVRSAGQRLKGGKLIKQ